MFEVRERLSGRLGEPSVPAARSEAGVAEDVSAVAPPSVLSAAPSSRPRIVLDRPKPHGGDARPRPAAAASPMEVAASDPPTPVMPLNPMPEVPHVPMQDSDMLIDVANRLREAMTTEGADRPAKVPRIARVGAEEYPINDEVLESAPEWEDAEYFLELGESAQEEWDIPEDAECWQVLANEDSFWFDSIPDLSEQELMVLDSKADQFEVQRLVDMKVIEPFQESDGGASACKELSSKFVRTWRPKERNGKEQFYRRSRLVARDFKWLQRDREGLYSPATSAAITKLIPWLFCEMNRCNADASPESEVSILALDVKDAYLTVPQPTPMKGTLSGFGVFRFLRMIPGQREGSSKWHQHIMKFLRDRKPLQVCPECPAVFLLDSNPALGHVDDFVLVARTMWIKQVCLPLLQSEFQISYQIATREGDSFKFLKRLHVITETGIIVQPNGDYASKLSEILDVPKEKGAKTPCTKELMMVDSSAELAPNKASKYRSAVGVMLYLSQDRVDIAFAVRILAQKLKCPTQRSWEFARRLCMYINSTSSYATCISAGEPGASILSHGVSSSSDAGEVLLEVFVDADWAGNRQTRRSMSSGVYYINGCPVYSTVKSQRCISLSSAESEFYSLVSGACEGLFLKRILAFVMGCSITMRMRTDNQAARQIALKQGVSKIRHLDGRYLWVQEQIAAGAFTVSPIDGRINPADVGTKVPASQARLKALLRFLGVVQVFGQTIELVGEEECNTLRQSVFKQHETAQVRRLLNKALRVHGLSNPSVCAIVLGLLSNVASASDAESEISDGFEIVRTSTETPGRISMTVMIFTFAFGILIGWMMHMLVPQSADDDEPNVSTDNATIASCDPNPPPSASLNEWLHVSHLTFLEAGWERVTTWMVLICIAFKTLFCNCFCRFLSLGPGYASAETANVQVEVASKGVSANMQHAPEAVGAQVILANAVYVTKTGKHYHHESCGHVRGGNSKRYTPCSFCRNEFLDG